MVRLTSLKQDEILSDKFKPHKWSMLSVGDLARIKWYMLMGYDSSVQTDEVHKPIFAKAYEAGLCSQLRKEICSLLEYTMTNTSQYGFWGDSYYNGGFTIPISQKWLATYTMYVCEF